MGWLHFEFPESFEAFKLTIVEKTLQQSGSLDFKLQVS